VFKKASVNPVADNYAKFYLNAIVIVTYELGYGCLNNPVNLLNGITVWNVGGCSLVLYTTIFQEIFAHELSAVIGNNDP
jgi:hypothetical protein